MKSQHYILLLIFALFVFTSKGQSFEPDWIDYKLPVGWKIDVKKKTQYLNYAEREMLGELNFIYRNDSADHKVSYIVFEYPHIDTTLTKNLLQYLMIQSCLDFVNTDQPFLQSFERNGFYYFLKPCHGCHQNKYIECQELANKLDDFVSESKRMELTLKAIVEQMFRLAEFEYSKDQIESKWCGNKPATVNEIKENEERLGIELPHDYKRFLLRTNGFHAFNLIQLNLHFILLVKLIT